MTTSSRLRKKGKLIVIDGNDGSGKATQVALLKKRLTKEGFSVKTIDFPRYGSSFFGKLTGEFLKGSYGDFSNADPRLASIMYAGDRFEALPLINSWLKEGYIVLADRYVSANQIHQGGKIKSEAARREFLKWLHEMEHSVFRIPEPDLVVYLSVPISVSLERLKQKAMKDKKKYLKGRKDVVEENLRYLNNSRKAANWLHRINKSWIKIECCPKGRVLSPEEVHNEIIGTVRKLIT